MFWGAFDTTYDIGAYSGAGKVSGGASAAVGAGTGVRRAVLRFTRTPPGVSTDDVAEVHHDFINYTGGTPDDTWTTADFTTLETALVNWWVAIQGHISNDYHFSEIRWYRVGTGVFPPNPAERVTPMAGSGSSGAAALPPQVAISITYKTAARKQWGRTYLGGITVPALASHGAIDPDLCDTLGTATDALVAEAFSHEFLHGVTSKVAGSFLATETIQVDDVFDVIRSRRWKHATHKYDTP